MNDLLPSRVVWACLVASCCRLWSSADIVYLCLYIIVYQGEAGGITQKLSAFNVEMDGRAAVFLDTPGHAAFTGMRKSGAIGSDLVVLVVAIEDGVRPLTIEAAKVALKSGCTIFVALTKVDKLTDAQERETARRKALTGLVEVDIVAEEFGGDIQVVEVSGKTGEGVSDLVEKLLLQADMMELKASEAGGAEGVVLDAKIEKGRGVMVDLLLKWEIGRASCRERV